MDLGPFEGSLAPTMLAPTSASRWPDTALCLSREDSADMAGPPVRQASRG
jgi:hypothetical protein